MIQGHHTTKGNLKTLSPKDAPRARAGLQIEKIAEATLGPYARPTVIGARLRRIRSTHRNHILGC
jgi:hypothetical protein